MSNLISRSAMLEHIDRRIQSIDIAPDPLYRIAWEIIRDYIEYEAPAVDAVPVVRCRECKYFKWGDYCTQDKMEHSKCRPDEFCSCGEKNDGGESDDED